MADRFVRLDLFLPEGAKGADRWQEKRKLRFGHKELRDVVKDSGLSVQQLLSDPFGGWPYLLQYGLRWQDLLTLDKCSELIDGWRDSHPDEGMPLESLGQKLIEALNASGFLKFEAEKPIEKDADSAGGDDSGNA